MRKYPNNIKKIIRKRFETTSFTPTGRALQKMGIDEYQFDDFFHEKVEMTLTQAMAIAKFFNVNVSELIPRRRSSKTNWKELAEMGITKESIRKQVFNN